MIWNEIRNRIEAKGDIHESKNNSRNKERKEYQNQKKERPVPRKAYSHIEHLHNRNKRPISERANPESSESDLVSVCVKRRTRTYKQCAQNKNKINCSHKITK